MGAGQCPLSPERSALGGREPAALLLVSRPPSACRAQGCSSAALRKTEEESAITSSWHHLHTFNTCFQTKEVIWTGLVLLSAIWLSPAVDVGRGSISMAVGQPVPSAWPGLSSLLSAQPGSTRLCKGRSLGDRVWPAQLPTGRPPLVLGQENEPRGRFTSEGVGFKCDGCVRISVLTTRANGPWEVFGTCRSLAAVSAAPSAQDSACHLRKLK